MKIKSTAAEMMKRAADGDFEKAFSTLAYSEMQQKAPGLFPYLIGFQLLKRNDEDTHAAGVFGFKVGDQWCYGPVFWLNGRMKGFDLLYVQSQDLFVPLQESWVNYIINRRPYQFGKPEKKSPMQLGVSSPDFTIFRRSPLTKVSSEKHWLEGAVGMFKPSTAKIPSVMEVLSKTSSDYANKFINRVNKDELLKSAMFTFYKPEELVDAIKQVIARDTIQKQSADFFVSAPRDEVRVQYGNGSSEGGLDSFTPLSTEQKEKLLSEGVVIEDWRAPADRATVYANPELPKVFQNPSKAGLWSTLMQDGSLVNCIVITDPKVIGVTIKKPVFATVIDQEGKAYANISQKGVFCKTQIDQSVWNKTFDALPDADSLSVGDIAVLIRRDFDGTIPFRVNEVTKRSDKTVVYCVGPIDCVDIVKNKYEFTDKYDVRQSNCNEEHIDYAFDKHDQDRFIHIVNGSTRPLNIRATMLVGKEMTKAIKLANIPKPSDDSNSSDKFWSWKNDHKIALGTTEDIDIALRKSGLVPLSVVKTKQAFVIEFGREKVAVDKSHALGYLVKNVGAAEEDARDVIKLASDKKFIGFVKRANSLFYNAPGPMYDSIYNSQAVTPWDTKYVLTSNLADQAQLRDETLNQVNDTPNGTSSGGVAMPDEQARNQAVNAANQGQKDVFDVSVLLGMVRSHSSNDLVQEYVKDIIVGNDRIGRTLFLYYWNFDEFIEKFGDDEMIELEDLLRDTFKACGDLVLFLKQKSVEPDSVANQSAVTL